MRSRKTSLSTYHFVNRQLPLPVRLAMMTHTKIRNLDLFERLPPLGICITKLQLTDVSTFMGNSMINTKKKTWLLSDVFKGWFVFHSINRSCWFRNKVVVTWYCCFHEPTSHSLSFENRSRIYNLVRAVKNYKNFSVVYCCYSISLTQWHSPIVGTYTSPKIVIINKLTMDRLPLDN